MTHSRKLAAIMFTDIEGYTALMQKNEKKAIETREKHRLIYDSAIEKFDGKTLQYYGDGTLSTFDSVIDAVNCGIEMQLGFRRDPGIPVRIGIHIGDIVFNEEEIIGDGVNIASRIESLGVAGSVLISDKVYGEIKNQESIKATRLKRVNLKNVEESIEIFAITNEGIVVPKADDLKGKTYAFSASKKGKIARRNAILAKRVVLTAAVLFGLVLFSRYYLSSKDSVADDQSGVKSIAVLAFENMSGDPNQDYFGDGISEEILNSLVKVEGLNVAGRTSSFYFKDKNEDIKTIGEKLDVSMVLEGSVRKFGDIVRITAQLINVEDGFHIWSETYDIEMKDIFSIQEEIATRITRKLQLEIYESSEPIEPNHGETYDLLLKGQYFFNKHVEGYTKAMEYFKQAAELDPAYAPAHSWVADTYLNFAVYGFMPNDEAYVKAQAAADLAIGIDEHDARAHKVLAYVNLNYNWDWDEALKEYEMAIHSGLLDPDYFISLYDIFVDEDFDHSIAVAKSVLGRDPIRIRSQWNLGLSYFLAEQYDSAILSFDKVLELDSNYSEAYRWRGLALANKGDFQEAIQSITMALQITKGKGPANLDMLEVKVKMGKTEEVMEVLRKWEHPDAVIDPIAPAVLYALLGMGDESVAWLEKSYEAKEFLMVSLKFYSVWDPIRDNPGFQAIYKKMNFPE
jgi:adenylate cyclase